MFEAASLMALKNVGALLVLEAECVAGIVAMHIIRKGQLGDIKDQASSPAKQFYSLAF